MPNLYLEKVTRNAPVPERKTTHAACYDIRADIENRTIIFYRSTNLRQIEICHGIHQLYPGERALIPTGWKMCCDPNWKIELAPRSGISLKVGVTLINSTGILDADYRDEAMVILVNHGAKTVNINDRDRIAQLSLEKVYDFNMVFGKLPATNSNRKGGMGHTGKD